MLSIGLLGIGSFGVQYFKEVSRLEQQGKCCLDLLATKTGTSRVRVEPKQVVKLRDIKHENLAALDGIIIATPSGTHAKAAIACAGQTNVLVEKPICSDDYEYQQLNTAPAWTKPRIYPSQIFRFHPLTNVAAQLFRNDPLSTLEVRGMFKNPGAPRQNCMPRFEMLHIVDVVDYLFRLEGYAKRIMKKKDTEVIDVQYVGERYGQYELGWDYKIEEPVRYLSVRTEEREVQIDFVSGQLKNYDLEGGVRTYSVQKHQRILRAQIKNFLACLSGEQKPKAYLDDTLRVYRVLNNASRNWVN